MPRLIRSDEYNVYNEIETRLSGLLKATLSGLADSHEFRLQQRTLPGKATTRTLYKVPVNRS